MKLINHSNSMHTYKVKRKINKFKLIEYIIVILFLSLITGFLYEAISNNKIVTSNKIKNKIVTINGSKIQYNTQGQGSFTVVLESDMGMTNQEWSKVLKAAPKDMRLFYYDRAGLGKSESTEKEVTPETEAKELYKILNKAGLNGPYILVGNGYGSLITQEFINLYKDDVGGVVFVDGYTNEDIQSNEFKKENKNQITKLKSQKLLSRIGITRAMDKFNIIKYPKGLLEGLSESDVELYRNYRVTGSFCETFLKERESLASLKVNNLSEGVLEDKPVFVITSRKGEQLERQKEFLKLSSKSEINSLEDNDILIPLEKPETIVNAIKSVSKKIPKTTN